MTGKLITIEGIDGSGKTTVWEQISDMGECPIDVFTTEPTRWSDPGKLLMEKLKTGDGRHITELFLFMADHNEHVEEKIRPNLADGKVILSDRYIDSRCAYQGATLENKLENPVEYIYNIHEEWSIIPDTTIWLDISIEEAQNRLETNHKHESRERLETVRENYQKLLEKNPGRFVRVNGEQSVEEVIAEVAEIIRTTVQNTD